MKKDRSNKNSNLKILLIGPDADAKGGISASISLINRSLKEHGVSVFKLATVNPDSGAPIRLIIFVKSILLAFWKLMYFRPNIAHIHMASRGSFLRKSIICLLCLAFKTPYIIHLHGGGFRDFYQGLSRLPKLYLRFIFKKSSCTITLSSFWSEWVKTEFNPRCVVVVPNGVHDISFQSEERSKSAPTVLFLGLLGKNKGTDTLIEAMRKVAYRKPDAVLELCGNGDIAHYKEQARGIPNVKFLGWINTNEKIAALERARVYCLPSWKEGLPFSILEAMSAGLPVISTPVGSIPEAVINGVNGFLVQPGDVDGLSDAILEVLSNSDLAQKMGAAGHKIQKERFSIPAMTEGCFEAYHAAIMQKQPNHH